MKILDKLRKEAIHVCKGKGHVLTNFSRKYKHFWTAGCKKCGEAVTISDAKHPDYIAPKGTYAPMFGRALHVKCIHKD